LKVVRAVAVALYWVATRALLFAALLFCSLFFVLNAGPFPARLTETLRAALPGRIDLSGLQVSPVPWNVDLLGVRITTPDDEEVIHAGSIRIGIDLGPLVRFLLGESNNVLEVRFSTIRLADFEVDLDFPRGGRLRLVDAFAKPPKPDHERGKGGGGGPDVRVVFSRIVAERGACTLRFPEWDLRVTGLSFETDMRIAGGVVLIRTPDLQFSGEVGLFRLPRDIAFVPKTIPMLRGRVTGFDLHKDGIGFERAQISFEGMDLDASGRLEFPPGGPLDFAGRAHLSFPAGSPLLATGTAGTVSGAVDLRVEGSGTSLDPAFRVALASPGLAVLGTDLGAVAASVSGGRDENGAYVFRVPTVTAHPAGGKVEVSDLGFHPYGPVRDVPGPPEGVLKVAWADLDTEALLAVFGLAMPARPWPVPTRSAGSAEVVARLGGDDGTRLDVAATAEGPLPPRTLLAGREVSVRVSGRADFPAAGPVLRISEAAVRSGGDQVRARGTVDLGAGTVDARGVVEKDLASLLALAGLPGEGRVGLSNVRVRGPLSSPSVSATVRAAGLAFDPWEVTEAAAEVSLRDGVIEARDVTAATPFGAVAAKSATLALDARLRLAVEGASVRGLDLTRFPPTRAAGLRARGDVAVDRLALDLADPAASLDGVARASFPTLGVVGRTLTKLDAAATVRAGLVTVTRAEAGLRGGGSLALSGWIDARARTADLSAGATGVPLSVAAGGVKALKGTVDVLASVQGRLADPVLKARAEASGVAFGDLSFGALSLAAAREPGGDLVFSSDRFLPKLSLDPASRLVWNGTGFDRVVVAVHVAGLTPQDVFPSVRQRDFSGEVTADVSLSMGLGAGGALEAWLSSPPGGLAMRFMDRQVELTNRAALRVETRPDGSVTLSGLALDDGRRRLDACGVVMDPDGAAHLWVHGDAGMYWLRAMKEVFSVAEGYVRLAGLPGEGPGEAPIGCDPARVPADGVLRVEGTTTAPSLRGSLTTGAIELALRSSADPIHVRQGGRILLRPGAGGRTDVEVPPDGWVRGSLGEGSFAVRGRASLVGIVPDSGEVHVAGTGLRISVPGQFYAVLDPELYARFDGLAAGAGSQVAIAGDINVSEGSYYRNFDVLRKAFSGVARDRVAEREGPPITSVAPWLADATLDLAITGTRLGLRSRLPVGSTDLELALDLAVRGTLAEPELWNRVEVVPGGKVTYDIVRREFEVVRGTLDFRGEPGKPLVDVTARTRVEFKGAGPTQSLAGGHAPDVSTDAFNEDTVLVTLRLFGEYPNLDVSLSSTTSELDQADLQYLLLTGMNRRDATQAQGGTLSIPVLGDDVAGLARQLLLAPFVDAIRLGVSPTGAVNAEVMAHLGTRLKFETQVLREQGGGSRYTAGFQMRLTDRLSLDGRVRAVDPAAAGPNEQTRLFESKLRYRIPLD